MDNEFRQLQLSSARYRVRSTPDEAAVRLDRWWIEKYVEGPAVLELGCADGVATEMLLQQAAHLDVVDGSLEYCALLRERINDRRVTIIHALYEEFEPSRCYDDIIIARSLEMVEDPIAILSRIRNWLSRNGRLHIVVQNAESLHRRIGHALGLLPRLDAISEANARIGNRRIYTEDLLAQHVGAAELTIAVFRGYFLKPFDWNTMSHARVDLVRDLVPALSDVGDSVPDELCHFFYACCRKAP